MSQLLLRNLKTQRTLLTISPSSILAPHDGESLGTRTMAPGVTARATIVSKAATSPTVDAAAASTTAFDFKWCRYVSKRAFWGRGEIRNLSLEQQNV